MPVMQAAVVDSEVVKAKCVWCGSPLDLDDDAERAYSTCRGCLGLPDHDAP